MPDDNKSPSPAAMPKKTVKRVEAIHPNPATKKKNKPTPKQKTVVSTSINNKINDLLRKAFDDGHDKGLEEGRTEIIDWLQGQYLKPEVKKDDKNGRAILQLAAAAAKRIRDLRSSQPHGTRRF